MNSRFSCAIISPTHSYPIPTTTMADNATSTGYSTESFPAPGLRQIVRHITGHNENGDSVFLLSDNGEHYRLMVEKQAVANILYSTRETPVQLTNNIDLQKAREAEVSGGRRKHPPAGMVMDTDTVSRRFITRTAPSSA